LVKDGAALNKSLHKPIGILVIEYTVSDRENPMTVGKSLITSPLYDTSILTLDGSTPNVIASATQVAVVVARFPRSPVEPTSGENNISSPCTVDRVNNSRTSNILIITNGKINTKRIRVVF